MLVTSSTAKVLTPNAIALGNFDGIHRGHQRVLQPILQRSSLTNQKKERSYATVVTFNPHPQEYFTGQTRQLLTPLKEKVKQLEILGVEQLLLLPFDREIASLSPQQFVEEILIKQLQASLISVGEDFRFGRERAGSAIDLQAIAALSGVEVVITKLQIFSLEEKKVRISSSLIRQALEQGEIRQANQMLGRFYSLCGTVVGGQQLGRTIGFPTANLELPNSKFLPRQGVYSVQVFIEEDKNPIKGVMNIGSRPTVDGTRPTVEVHLLDWCGYLYGKTLLVKLEDFLRKEQKFSSLEALKSQIAADCQAAKKIAKYKL